MSSQQSRVRTLSTRFHKLYKYGVVVVVGVLLIMYLYFELQEILAGQWVLITQPFILFYLGWFWMKAHRNVFQVEFDDEFLYVHRKSVELLIPLENIKEIEIVSVGGVYRIDLYSPETFGDKLYFKPSLLYPLNYKSKDELVNLLWSKIEKAKNTSRPMVRNALHS